MPKFSIKVDGREFEAESPNSIAAVRATFATYQGARSVVVRAAPKDMGDGAAAELETKK